MKTVMIIVGFALVTGLLVGDVSAQQPPAPTATPSDSSPSAPGAQPSTPPASAPAPPPPPSASTSSTAEARSLLVDAGSLIGAVVRNPEGKDIGKVSSLMLDPRDGRVASAVVTVGGVLGMGGSTVAVPWNSLRIGRDNTKLVVTMDQSALEQAPSAAPRTSGDEKKK